ncbi:hypothetical protein [Erythrobacter sp. F6033]|uniref:hypothetical protein n=1 Tax=Erythrobacter sp. F6033 TaxID=2926401 RepID=UPI001FF6D094|nr:hypothetical protein [Erythrobacter sp. F6033]MCK0129506.1 hypothetical protein [Erythrobacter sp. F6033]
MSFNHLVFSAKMLALCAFTSLASSAPSLAQESSNKVTLFQKEDGGELAIVSRFETTCTLRWFSETDLNGFAIIIGKTTITSDLLIFTDRDMGSHGGDMTLRRFTKDGIAASTVPFGKKSLPEGFFQYVAKLNNLKIDFDVFKVSGDLLLQTETEGPVVIEFRSVLRDEAVAELGKCLETQPEHWTLEKGLGD